MILRPVPSAPFKFSEFFFFLKIESSYGYPSTTQKPVLKELFNLQLWAPIPFQHEKILFHLPLFIS